MELVLPSVEYKDTFLEAAREYCAESVRTWRHERYHEALKPETNFATFVEHTLSQARGENLPPGYIPQTDYWLIEEGEFIGRVSIRHRLTEHLLAVGGLIGHDVRPSKRGQGYGNKIL